jgi:hypothetical protein
MTEYVCTLKKYKIVNIIKQFFLKLTVNCGEKDEPLF